MARISIFVVGCVVLLASQSALAISWVDGIGMSNELSLQLGEAEPNRSAGRIQGGSSVLIHPRWALTARHFNANGRRVTFQQPGQGSTVAGTVIAHSSSDLSLIQLDQPAVGRDRRYHAPYFRSDEVGKFMWKAGYGRFGIDARPSNPASAADGQRRAMTNVVSRVGTDHGLPPSSFGQLLGFSRTAASGADITQYEGSTAPGDSGGPTYLEHEGRWYVGGVTFGAIGGWGFAETRISSNLGWIEQTTGIDFAYPTPLRLVAEWDASSVEIAGGASVSSWADEDRERAFFAERSGPRPTYELHATPSGAPAIDFSGQQMTLAEGSNPISGLESFSIAAVIRVDAPGDSGGGQWWSDTGILTAGEDDWGLTIDDSGQPGWGIGGDADLSFFVGDTTVRDDASLVGDWRLVAATWDGSREDGAMSLYIDDALTPISAEGPRYADVARQLTSLRLGTNEGPGFDGAIAELRLYEGELSATDVTSLFDDWEAEYLLPTLAGDLNHDGFVDAADYTIWRDSFGATDITPFSLGDANGDGSVSTSDYDIWQANFGAILPAQLAFASTEVPEPTTALLSVLTMLFLSCGHRRAGLLAETSSQRSRTAATPYRVKTRSTRADARTRFSCKRCGASLLFKLRRTSQIPFQSRFMNPWHVSPVHTPV